MRSRKSVVALSARHVETLERRQLLSGNPHDTDAFVTQTNLVSDIPGLAAHTDPNLLNPWGVSYSPTSPFWVSENNAGVATLYDGNGVAQPAPTPQNPNAKPLVVTIPGAGSTAANPVMGNPTGQVFVGGTGFPVTENGKTGNSVFVFVGEDGGISGWSPSVDHNNAVIAVNNPSNPTDPNSGAVYKGATLAAVGGQQELFVTNFRSGHVEVYGSNFQPIHTDGFSDPRIPDGYAPFNIQNVNGDLYVTFAKQNQFKHDDVAGAGNGFVDVFNTSGVLERRLQHGKFLDSPWGMAVAPASWGKIAGDILVGNFGSGRIDIFSPKGHFRGFLRDAKTEKPVTIDGLWTIKPGDNTGAGSSDDIYFTAGLNGETDGLFGSLAFTKIDDPSQMLVGR